MRRSIPGLNIIGQVDLLNNPHSLLLIGADFVCAGLGIVHWVKRERRRPRFQQENLRLLPKNILAYVGTSILQYNRVFYVVLTGLFRKTGINME